jgi:RimJ/RimL family protein N-acetyltransferase
MADLRAIEITSTRLGLRSFKAEDAAESFAEVTPTLTRFMAWDPSPSLAVFAEIWRGWLPRMTAGTHLALTIRLQSTAEFMGMAGLLCIGQPEPEIGIWIKEAAHGAGYGREAVAAVVAWHSRETGANGFTYPVAIDNWRSRSLAESLCGRLVGTRELRKPSGVILEEVVYLIPAVRA